MRERKVSEVEIKLMPKEAKEELARRGVVCLLEYEDYDGYPDFVYLPVDSVLKYRNEYKDAMSYRILTRNGEEILFDDFEEFINYLREHF